MSDVDSASTTAPTTETATPPAATVAPQQSPPQPAPQPVATQPHSSGRSPGQELLDAINALPERIVASIREATPAQPAKSQPAKTETKTEAKAEAKPAEPAKKTFSEWWFG